MAPRGRTIGLTKTIEYMRQKLRRDTNAGIDHFKMRMRAVEPRRYSDFSTLIGELDRVRHQVPRNLLQTHRLAHHDQTRRPKRHQHLNIPSGCSREHGINSSPDCGIQIGWLWFEV